MNFKRTHNLLICIVISSFLVIVLFQLDIVSGNALPVAAEKEPGADNKFHSWDGRFYDNVVHDTKKYAEDAIRKADESKHNLTTGQIIGISVGGALVILIIFCCIGYCLCACVREMLCCVKNLVCCCCDD